MGFTNEQPAKARQAKSAEELFAIAKENGIEMTEEEAKKNFAQLHQDDGLLSDETLENVTGGSTVIVGGEEYTRVYSGTDCFKRFGSQSWSGFDLAECPNYFKHPIYWNWWVCSTKGECGCCQHLYIDGAGTGICWSEVNGAASWPPDYRDRM